MNSFSAIFMTRTRKQAHNHVPVGKSCGTSGMNICFDCRKEKGRRRCYIYIKLLRDILVIERNNQQSIKFLYFNKITQIT